MEKIGHCTLLKSPAYCRYQYYTLLLLRGQCTDRVNCMIWYEMFLAHAKDDAFLIYRTEILKTKLKTICLLSTAQNNCSIECERNVTIILDGSGKNELFFHARMTYVICRPGWQWEIQGSYRPWKVLELKCWDFQAWKVLEKDIGPGKPWKSPGILN